MAPLLSLNVDNTVKVATGVEVVAMGVEVVAMSVQVVR